ncbi:AAA family ATPase, partial [bacterium]|nr:AAA family ATPase [bacterium]
SLIESQKSELEYQIDVDSVLQKDENIILKVEDLNSIMGKIEIKSEGEFTKYTPHLFWIKTDFDNFRVKLITQDSIVLISDSSISFNDDDIDKLRTVFKNSKISPITNSVYDKQKMALDNFLAGDIQNNKIQIALLNSKKIEGYEISDINNFEIRLNRIQQEAVRKALSTPDILLIQGPSGTGKTSTIAEIVIQQLKKNPASRVLITSQSNVAVDNALERIIKSSFIDNKLIIRYASKTSEVKVSNFLKSYISIGDVKDNKQIVGVTTMGIMGIGLNKLGKFDLAIVDEAGRATFPEILPALLKTDKVIIVGDHKQLPPVVETLPKNILEKYSNGDFIDLWDKSLFEILIDELPPNRVTLLDTQYRMNPNIGTVVSELFYQSLLKNGKNFEESLIFSNDFYWWYVKNTDGIRGESKSLSNFKEAEFIIKRVIEYLSLINNNLKNSKYKNRDSIAILTPYRDQKELLDLLFDKYKNALSHQSFVISTIDAFQGQEADTIIYSSVKTSGNPDFLADDRRLNVSISRARKNFIVVGDPNVLTSDSKSYFKKIKLLSKLEEFNSINKDLKTKIKEYYKMEKIVNNLKQSTLFITFGKRDLMYVYEKEGVLYRKSVDGDINYLISSQLNLYSLDEIKTELKFINNKGNDFELNKPIGVVFPMFEKSLKYFKTNGIEISRIYFLYTDRGELKDNLIDILNFTYLNNHSEFSRYVKDLIKYIDDDYTSKFINKLKDFVEDSSVYKKLNIKNSTQFNYINIAKNRKEFSKISLESIKNAKNDDEIYSIISRGDINRGDFFYPVIYKELKKLTNELKNSYIYYSIYGGMPVFQRVFEHMLKIVFDGVPKESIYLSEKEFSYGFNIPEYSNFYDTKQKISHYLSSFDISISQQLVFKLFEEYPAIDESIKTRVLSSFDKIDNMLKNQMIYLYFSFLTNFYKERWSELFFFLHNLKGVIFLSLLNEYNDDWIVNLKDRKIIFKNGSKIDLRDWNFFERIDKDIYKYPKLKRYKNLFMHSNFMNIYNQIQNYYLEKSESSKTIKEISFQFLTKKFGDKLSILDVILDLNSTILNGNIEDVSIVEKKLMGLGVFKEILQLIGIELKNGLFPIREIILDIYKAIENIDF